MANKKTLLGKVFERNGDVETLLQQASFPLRSRRQAHQVRIAGVISESVGHASRGRQPTCH
ncbi:MAG TPA: hypothetical protein VNB65_03920 [Gaiellaceae bacterium]|jgi:hypothetical protein|nr:hypothetical protein [Gaiellaceae bacterium]